MEIFMKPSTFSIRPSTEDSLRSSTVVLCPCTACRRQTKVLSETARSLPPAILKTKFVPRVFSVFNMAAHCFVVLAGNLKGPTLRFLLLYFRFLVTHKNKVTKQVFKFRLYSPKDVKSYQSTSIFSGNTIPLCKLPVFTRFKPARKLGHVNHLQDGGRFAFVFLNSIRPLFLHLITQNDQRNASCEGRAQFFEGTIFRCSPFWSGEFTFSPYPLSAAPTRSHALVPYVLTEKKSYKPTCLCFS